MGGTDNKCPIIALGAAAAVGGAVLLLAKLAEAAEPQPGKAHLYGDVVDETQTPIAGVSIQLDGRSAHTNTDGHYQILNIEPGEYSITFTKQGYETLTY